MQPCARWAIRSLRAGSLPLLNSICCMNYCNAVDPSRGILIEYHRLLDAGNLHPDATQLAAVQALQLLQDSMAIRKAGQAAAEVKTVQAAAAAAENSTTDPAADNQTTSLHSRDGQAHSIQPTYVSEVGSDDQSSLMAAAAPDAASVAVQAPATTTPVIAHSSSSSSSSRPVVQGAYLWGPVGSGKTLLMDMFLRTLPLATMPVSPNHSSNCTNSSTLVDQQLQQQQAMQQQLQMTTHRIHFHEFMLAVHEQLHQLQQSLPRIVTHSRAGLPVYRYAPPAEDPVLVLAKAAAAGLDLLCVDELHVTDVADAMLLSRLFEAIVTSGCNVIFTSNRPARDLYKGGLSRKYFEPFIKLIDDRLLQLKVAGGRDYRSQQRSNASIAANLGAHSTGLWLLGPAAAQQQQLQWEQLAQQMGAIVTIAAAGAAPNSDQPFSISLPFGRTLWVPRTLVMPPAAASGAKSSSLGSPQQQQQPPLAATWFTFTQLCSNQGSRQSLEHAGALSSNDYLALVRSCSVLFVQGIPQLTTRLRDEARRLVTLVDLMYEVHTAKPGSVRLVISAEVSPHELFLPLLGAAAAQGVNPNLGRSSGKLNVRQLVQDYRHQEDYDDSPSSSDGLGASVGAVGVSWRQDRKGSLPANDKPEPYSSSSSSSSSSSGGGSVHEGSSRHVQAPASALLPEEVLMYHRASSRLIELCSVVDTATAYK